MNAFSWSTVTRGWLRPVAWSLSSGFFRVGRCLTWPRSSGGLGSALTVGGGDSGCSGSRGYVIGPRAPGRIRGRRPGRSGLVCLTCAEPSGWVGTSWRVVSGSARRRRLGSSPALVCPRCTNSIPRRASRRTQLRYERQQPGDLVHIDVKKLGRIPDGGGWRLDGPDTIDHNKGRIRSKKLGMDYVHVAVEDHSRLAFARILPDEKGPTCAALLAEAAEFFADHGIQIRQVMTDNALNYRRSRDFQAMLAALQTNTHPDPTTLALAERESRTLQPHPARRMGLPVALHLETGPQ